MRQARQTSYPTAGGPSIFPPDLIQAIRAGECTLFVGAGLSIPAGYPSFVELIQELVDECTRYGAITPDEASDLRRLAEEGRLTEAAYLGRKRLEPPRFLAFMKQRFGELRPSPTADLEILATIPFRQVITTNWDGLVSRAFSRSVSHTWLDLAAAAFFQEHSVVQLHGSLGRPDSIVLTDADYNSVRSSGMVRDYLLSTFRSTTVLFVGCSMTDPHIKLRLGDAVAQAGGYPTPHFAILPNASRLQTEVLSDAYSVKTLRYESQNQDHSRLTTLLRALEKEVRQEAVPIEAKLRAALKKTINHCAQRNIRVQTPHVLQALYDADTNFIFGVFKMDHGYFGEAVRRYIYEFDEGCEPGAPAFESREPRTLDAVAAAARIGGVQCIEVGHVLLMILESHGNTVNKIQNIVKVPIRTLCARVRSMLGLPQMVTEAPTPLR